MMHDEKEFEVHFGGEMGATHTIPTLLNYIRSSFSTLSKGSKSSIAAAPTPQPSLSTAFIALNMAFTMHPESVEEFGSHECIEIIQYAIQHCEMDILVYALITLETLSNGSDDLCDAIIDAHVVPLLVETMEKHFERSLDVVSKCWGVLWRLADGSEKRRNHMLECSPLSKMMQNMVKQPLDHKELVGNYALSVAYLANSEGNVQNDSLEYLMNAYRIHRNKKNVVNAILIAFQNTSMHRKQVKQKLFSLNVLDCLKECMIEHAMETDVMECVFGVLRNLVSSCRREDALGIVSSGIIDIVVQRLEEHVIEPRVFENGCRLVWNMGMDDNASSFQLAETALRRAVAVILKGVKLHSNNPEILLAIVDALALLLEVYEKDEGMGFDVKRYCGDCDVNDDPEGAKEIESVLLELVDAMRKECNIEMDDMIEGVMKILSFLCGNSEDRIVILLSAHVDTLIVKSLELHMDDEDVVESIAHLLNMITFVSMTLRHHLDPMIESGVLQLLMTALRVHFECENVVSPVSRILWNLSTGSEDVCVLLAEARVIPILLDLCKFHLHNAVIVRSICIILWNLALNSLERIELMDSSGALPMIHEVFSLHNASSDVMSAACGALQNIVRGSMKRIDASVESGAIEQIVNTLRQHIDVEDVVQTACGALENLSAGSSTVCTMIAFSGAIPLILDGLKRHIEVGGVVESACGVVWNLCYGLDDKDVSDGIADTIVKGLERHVDVPGVVESACGAIEHLVLGSEDRKSYIDSLLAIPIIVQGLGLHLHNHEVVHNSCGALRNLAIGSMKRRNEIGAAKTISLVVTALREHQKYPDVVESICGLLENVCIESEDRKRIVADENDAIPLMADLLQQNVDHDGIASSVCGVLRNLAAGSDDRMNRMESHHVIEHIVHALERHIQNPEVVQSACGALQNLALGSDERLLHIINLGAIPLIVEGLVRHHGRQKNVLAGSRALRNLASMDGFFMGSCLTPSERDALDLMRNVFAGSPGPSDVLERAEKLMVLSYLQASRKKESTLKERIRMLEEQMESLSKEK